MTSEQTEFKLSILNLNLVGETVNKTLIPIQPQQFNGETVDTVNARELHTFLESKQQFSDWIKGRIDTYQFLENQDFICVSENYETQRKDGQKGAVIRTEYHITLDMAKELAMVERTAKGREARQYFIACEKVLIQQQTQPLGIEPEFLEALQGELAIAQLRSHNFETKLTQTQRYYSEELDQERQLKEHYRKELRYIHLSDAMSFSEVAEYLSISLDTVHSSINTLGWTTESKHDDMVIGEQLQLSKEASENFYLIAISELNNDAYGRERTFRQVKMSRKGLRVLANYLNTYHALVSVV